MTKIKTTSYGKWILAGEHSVLRGAPALAFPSYQHRMDFEWNKSDSPLTVGFEGNCGDEVQLAFWGVMESALNKVKISRNHLKGHLLVVNNIPLGGGLGASAALCVGVAKLICQMGWVNENELFEFSRKLENLFHGESSGVDIAVSLRGEGIEFIRDGNMSPIEMNWAPQLYLSYSGQKGVTSDCVNRVKDLFDSHPDLAKKIDLRMKESVSLAKQALLAHSEDEGLDLLARSIDSACQCFTQWKLVGNELGKHLQHLLNQGALAVKPTGSGGGGYVLSLWKNQPPKELLKDLIILKQL